ncbi:hypothetical protein [Cellulosimicrobium protaetiae]|uniref:Uncharacterized protein n=1 Tax=Cellulosimicrobium protaetiae TaxID=2587808 RepID=A0A6M5UJW7_9MICO|nr:hypothetical protein [Cellulosimicrobium protaetiae]QJW37613.1 hypothetical protein FIC82_016905 [Cellulosimicrobium protaetiae]
MIQTSEEPQGVDLFLPAAYDLVWTGAVLAVLVALGAAVVLAVRAATRTPSLHGLAGDDPVRRAARRHATTVSVAAATAAVLAGAVVAQAVTTAVGGLAEGVLVGLSPAVVGLTFLGAHAVGERTWPRQRTAVRAATLRPRTVDDVAPRGLRRLTWSLGALVVLLAGVGALTAGDDGRSVTRVLGDTTSTASPYPGEFYGVWLALAAVLLVAGAEGVLRLVARRPAVAQVDETWDVALRRASAHRVLRGAQLALGLTAAGTVGVGANAAARAGYPGAVVLVVAAVGLALAAVAVVVQPAPEPDDRADERADGRTGVPTAGAGRAAR